MMKFSLMVATAASLVALTVPASAGDYGIRDGYRYQPPRAVRAELPVQDATRWGFSQGYGTPPSGFGGLYGDGRYPGNVYDDYAPSRACGRAHC